MMQRTEFIRMLAPALAYASSTRRLTVSMENVDIVVYAPKNPVNRNVLPTPSEYIP